jgi:hypothetical protein
MHRELIHHDGGREENVANDDTVHRRDQRELGKEDGQAAQSVDQRCHLERRG